LYGQTYQHQTRYEHGDTRKIFPKREYPESLASH